ncbi:MAG: META domain-containing protein [Dehalogenimonas sp.]
MKIKQILYLSGAILMLFLLPLVACSTKSDPKSSDLDNTKWQLQSYGKAENPIAVLNGTEITVTFDSGRVYGSAGVNMYSGSFEVHGNKISIIDLVWTEMYRQEPPGVMEQESEYLKIFKAADNFLVKTDSLQINAGNETLTYTEKTQGILRGSVTIGPITPVESPGEKPTVPPEVYEARKIMVYNESGDKLTLPP